MDLRRRLGMVSGGGQNYELIRSTQSLVDRLNLDSEDISIQPVHPSIMGQVCYLFIIYTNKVAISASVIRSICLYLHQILWNGRTDVFLRTLLIHFQLKDPSVFNMSVLTNEQLKCNKLVDRKPKLPAGPRIQRALVT